MPKFDGIDIANEVAMAMNKAMHQKEQTKKTRDEEDAIEPSTSPLDFLPYGTLAKGAAGIGKSLVQAAPKLLGNEVGSLGGPGVSYPGLASKLFPKAANASKFDQIISARAGDGAEDISHLVGSNVSHNGGLHRISQIHDSPAGMRVRLEGPMSGYNTSLEEVLNNGIPLDANYKPF